MTFDSDQEWFNLFVLHQNRVQRGFSNTHGWIEDRHLAAYEDLDFVLWGHEHQCLTETQVSISLFFPESLFCHINSPRPLEISTSSNQAPPSRPLSQKVE